MGSTCPICFEDIKGKIRASPDSCHHVFCLTCLQKCSKLRSYCPVDRKKYRKILNLESGDIIQIKPRKRKRTRTLYDFTTKCEVCIKDESAGIMLLCDSCDLGFHMHCLSPQLKKIPAGQWFCPTCITIDEKLKKRKNITKEHIQSAEKEATAITEVQNLNISSKESPLDNKNNENMNSVRNSNNLQDVYPRIIGRDTNHMFIHWQTVENIIVVYKVPLR